MIFRGSIFHTLISLKTCAFEDCFNKKIILYVNFYKPCLLESYRGHNKSYSNVAPVVHFGCVRPLSWDEEASALVNTDGGARLDGSALTRAGAPPSAELISQMSQVAKS